MNENESLQLMTIGSLLLIHFGNQSIDLVFTVTSVSAFHEMFDFSLLEASQGTAQLKRPQEVGSLLEVGSNRDDFVHQIFNANDAVRTKSLFNDLIVSQCDTLLVNLAVAALVDQITDRLHAGCTPSNVGFHQLEHLQGAVVQAHKDTGIDLDQSQ